MLSVPVVMDMVRAMLLGEDIKETAPEAPVSEPSKWQLSEQAINAALELEKSRLGTKCDLSTIRQLGRSLEAIARPGWSPATGQARVEIGFFELLQDFHFSRKGAQACTVGEIQVSAIEFAHRLEAFGEGEDTKDLTDGCLVLQRLAHARMRWMP